MINYKNVFETQTMIEEDKLDIRTITLGISLLDCIDSDAKKACEKIYAKIMSQGKDLVKVSNQVAKEYGIPIINKRISVTPISIIAQSTSLDDYTIFAKTLDQAAKELKIDFIGGFSALVDKGFSAGDKKLIDSIPRALKETDRICASVNVGSTKSGINMDAVKRLGQVIKESAELTKDKGSIACAKLVVFTNAVSDNPFMAGAFLGINERDSVINVGISGPGVVKTAIDQIPDASFDILSETIKKTAFKITRAGQSIAEEISKKLSIPMGIVDLSLAPTPAVGDSVARILESFGLEACGTHGTTAALALLNDAVKKGGVMAAKHVGGLSGAFIPVSEDEGMIEALKKGAITIDKLEAMTCVCSVGLDMIVIPGETPASTIAAMIADEMAIGMINQKTTAVRLIPAYGKKVGEIVHFGGLLGYAPVMAVNKFSSEKFSNRGGHIPAPIHSFKN